MSYFKFLEEVKESQRDPDHFKWSYSARNIVQPKGFYFSASERVKQTPAIFDYSKLETLIVAATLGKRK